MLQDHEPKCLKTQAVNWEQGTDQGQRHIRDTKDWPTGKPMPLLKRATTTQLHPIIDLHRHGPRVASFIAFAREARNKPFMWSFLIPKCWQMIQNVLSMLNGLNKTFLLRWISVHGWPALSSAAEP